jgi:hypothetical protein
MRKIVRLLAIVAVLVPGALHAQPLEPVATAELVLRDGSRVYGTVERETETEVVFRTASGIVLTAARDQIVSLRTVHGILRDGEFQPADPNTTRLFFAPTGRSLKRGQAYLGVSEFMVPTLQVGVTDRFSIGAGTPLIFGLLDEGDRPFWLTPKLQVFSGGDTDVAVGTFHVFGMGENAGIAYVVATHGSAAQSVTAGAGMAYNADGGRAGVFMLGGERSVRRNIALITENYMTSKMDAVLSGGVRFFGERLSADLAFVVPVTGESIFAIPVVNFVYLF